MILWLDVIHRDALEGPQRVSGADAPRSGPGVGIGGKHELQ